MTPFPSVEKFTLRTPKYTVTSLYNWKLYSASSVVHCNLSRQLEIAWYTVTSRLS